MKRNDNDDNDILPPAPPLNDKIEMNSNEEFKIQVENDENINDGRTSPLNEQHGGLLSVPSLQRLVRMGSSASDDVVNWYQDTFGEELSVVERSIKQARQSSLRGGSGRQLLSPSHKSSKSNDSEYNLALMKAQEDAENKAILKSLYETRLNCVEELENLRMRLVKYEEKALASRRQSAGDFVVSWDRDSDYSECYLCSARFSFSTRRHHCRKCGHIFCSQCAPKDNVAPLPVLGFETPVRHCVSCLVPEVAKKRLSGVAEVSRDETEGNEDPENPNVPCSKTIDIIRMRENACLKDTTPETIVSVLTAYSSCVKKLSKAPALRKEDQFRKYAHSIILKSIHSFLELPPIAAIVAISTDARHQAHYIVDFVMNSYEQLA